MLFRSAAKIRAVRVFAAARRVYKLGNIRPLELGGGVLQDRLEESQCDRPLERAGIIPARPALLAADGPESTRIDVKLII